MGSIIEKCLIFVYVVTKADGFHYRQPWVIGVQEEIERLTKRVEEAEQVMMGVSNLSKQIETLEVCEHCLALSSLLHDSYLLLLL